jgi:hypothetical protein
LGVPTSEVGYTSATTGRGDHEVHKGHVMALAKKNAKNVRLSELIFLMACKISLQVSGKQLTHKVRNVA